MDKTQELKKQIDMLLIEHEQDMCVLRKAMRKNRRKIWIRLHAELIVMIMWVLFLAFSAIVLIM